MSFQNSPLFHFIVGTLWFAAAIVTALEHQTFVGPVFWPPILLSAAGIYFYARGIFLIIKRRCRGKDL